MLKKFLEDKPLYYNKIDYERMPQIYARIKSYLHTPKTIHIVGTNGKGSTGRFLASALYSLGHMVGHYSSPHIVEFNERIWIDGSDISNKDLDKAHQKLQLILTTEESDSLSYFEYSTLLAVITFATCEYVIFEAGLGGERDATAIFDKILTLVTPIDIDHEAFLGSTIREIATTKLNAIQNIAIIAKQSHQEVLTIAKSRENITIYEDSELLNSDDFKKIESIKRVLELPSYQVDNLHVAISALKFLELEYSSSDFKAPKLFGRLSRVRENVLVDVGHNILAAKVIVKELKGQKFVLIYNSYEDKNYREILTHLKPIIEHIEIIELNDKRVVEKSLLIDTIEELEIEYSTYKKIDEKLKYLVFGSFLVVEKFLKSIR